MQMTAYGKKRRWAQLQRKVLILALFMTTMHLRALCQQLSLTLKNASLKEVFAAIEQQSNYHFIYVAEEIKDSKPVTISVTNTSIENLLNQVFALEPITYKISKNYITIHHTAEKKPTVVSALVSIQGKVVNERSEPIPGASILVKGTIIATATDANGIFALQGLEEKAVLVISSVGYRSREVALSGNDHLYIHLQTLVNTLDETVLIAYGKTTRRLNTGSVGKVSAAQIAEQPISNPLATLEARVPGLFITQQNGLPASDFSVLIRGRNSIQQGTNPLYVIDGTPFISDGLTQRSGGLGNNNPFNSINPNDIESIEVLKDADATSIYGSRGANGVILITTKKGRSGKTRLDLTYRSGWGKVTRTMNYLNTAQYLAMRKEAFRNDGVTPDVDNAPDLLVWDTTRYTDWKKKLIGGTARSQNIQLGLSGGNETTRFYLGANYYKETTVYPGNFSDGRSSIHLDVNHSAPNKKFNASLSVSYAEDKNNLLPFDLTQYINLAPNAPQPFTVDGHLNWSEGGVSFNNPMAVLLQTYDGTTDRLTASGLFSYQLTSGLVVKANVGYNFIELDEHQKFPMASFDPATFPMGAATFATNASKIYNLEPQAEYTVSVGSSSKLSALLGATWQQTDNHLSTIDGYSYSNDELLNSTTGSASLYTNYTSHLYRYNGVFGRINYNWKDQFLLNLTGRRDGSTRFGPRHQMANFYAIGGGWIFTEKPFVQKHLSFLSYGKLRGSYGLTGNDQIGNYQYLDTWSPTYFTYQGQPALRPTRLTNPDYSWELNKKLDLGLELGLFKQRVFITADWYRDRSDNQIIYYRVPAQTGFTVLLMNFPAVVQNSGWELELRGTAIQSSSFGWTVTGNLTIPKNLLKQFPGLEQSSYANSYVIGQPLDLYRGYQYTGIDPAGGIYQFNDLNKDGIINSMDYVTIGSTSPRLYGGLDNSFRYKGLEVNILFQFIKQKGKQAIWSLPNTPGMELVNFPDAVLNRWTSPGHSGTYQLFSQSPVSAATAASQLMYNSSAILTDASFVRLKTLSLSYALPQRWMKRTHLETGKLFLQAQNLWTLTSYQGADPESQNPTALPPLKMISLGIQIIL